MPQDLSSVFTEWGADRQIGRTTAHLTQCAR